MRTTILSCRTWIKRENGVTTVSEHTQWVREEASRRGIVLTPPLSGILDKLKGTAPVWLPLALFIILLVTLIKAI